MNKYPCAFLFGNGTAAYIDENGKQMGDLQSHNWRGLHLFIKKYPEAPVSIQFTDPVHPDLLEYVMSNIALPQKHLCASYSHMNLKREPFFDGMDIKSDFEYIEH